MKRLLLAIALLVTACSQGDDADGQASDPADAATASDGTSSDGTASDGAPSADDTNDTIVVSPGDKTDSPAPSEATENPADLPLATGDFLEAFDSRESMAGFDFYIANGRNYFNRPESWPADHATGGDCSGPDTTRTVSWPDIDGDDTVRTTDPGDTVYWCAPAGEGSGHFMTAFHTGGYAHLDFSPKQRFSDVRRVCWDLNATNLGNRQWHQMVIAPISILEPVAPRLDFTHPEFREGGPAAWGLEVVPGVFMFQSTQGAAQVYSASDNTTHTSFTNDLSVSDQKKRVTTCVIDRGANQIEIQQERWSGSTDVTTLPGTFPAGEVRVIFQDVSYDPDKSQTESVPLRDGYTWHWDNILVSSDVGP